MISAPRYVIADKSYDSAELREWLTDRGTQPVIPPLENRKNQYEYDRDLYKQRKAVERFFCRIKGL